MIDDRGIIEQFIGPLEDSEWNFLQNHIVIDQSPHIEMTLIQKDIPSKNLFLLIEGRFIIRVDQEIVNTLEDEGEVVGEMQWLTGEPPLATVTAFPGTKFLKVQFKTLEELDRITGGKVKQFALSCLPKIVAKRLRKTNDQAKMVNTLLQKVRTTEEQLRIMHQRSGSQMQVKLHTLENEFNKFGEYLRSQCLTTQSPNDLYQSTKSFVERCRNILSQGPTEHFLVQEVLDGKLKSALQIICQNIGIQEIKMDQFDPQNKEKTIFVIDTNSQDFKFFEDQQVSHAKAILLTNKIQNLEKSPLIETWNGHLCLIPNDISRNERIRSLLEILGRCFSGENWGMEQYLSWGTKTHSFVIQRSRDRKNLIEEIKSKLRDFKVREALIQRVELVLEELLMNALYDAPTDQQNKPLFNHLVRQIDVELPNQDQVKVQLGYDGMCIALGVTDPYGSLTLPTLLRYINLGLKGKFQQEKGKGGAGKGLFMIYLNSDKLIYQIKKGEKTEVIALFYHDLRETDSQEIELQVLQYP